MSDRLSQTLSDAVGMSESAYRLDPERITAMLPQPKPRETADAAPAAETAVGDAPAPAVAAVADSDMPGDLPDIAWSEVEMAECEEMYWRKAAGKREDVLTLIRALRETRSRLAEALDAYRRGWDAMQRERDEARAAGRALVAENAALRAERDRGRQLAQQVTHHLRSILALYDDISQNPRGGPPEARSDAKAAT